MTLMDILRRCDEARYVPGTPLDAFVDLEDMVQADPQAAIALLPELPRLTHCRRCLDRYRGYIRKALRQ
jgi:hypothetical protein